MLDLALAEIAAGMPDTGQFVRALLRLFTAALCGAAIGLQREHLGKPAGLRTHILVASATALFVVATSEAGMALPELSRIIYGLATGIGFIGAGAILKLERRQEVHGLTTAADLWLTAAIGVSSGLGRIGLALLATLLAWFVLGLLRGVERWLRPQDRRRSG